MLAHFVEKAANPAGLEARERPRFALTSRLWGGGPCRRRAAGAIGSASHAVASNGAPVRAGFGAAPCPLFRQFLDLETGDAECAGQHGQAFAHGFAVGNAGGRSHLQVQAIGIDAQAGAGERRRHAA